MIGINLHSTLLQPHLDSAIPISSQVRIFWRLVGIHHVILTINPLTLNTVHRLWSNSVQKFSEIEQSKPEFSDKD